MLPKEERKLLYHSTAIIFVFGFGILFFSLFCFEGSDEGKQIFKAGVARDQADEQIENDARCNLDQHAPNGGRHHFSDQKDYDTHGTRQQKVWQDVPHLISHFISDELLIWNRVASGGDQGRNDAR